MHTHKKVIVAVAGVAGLAIVGFFMPKSQAVAQGGPQVSIVSPLPLPVNVTNTPTVDTPIPFQTLLCTLGFPNPACSDTLTVPAGKRLVIEYVSGGCTSSLTETASFLAITTHVGGVATSHRAVPQFIGASASSKVYTVAQQTRIYADTGTTLSVSVATFPGVSFPTCSVAISGHHVTL